MKIFTEKKAEDFLEKRGFEVVKRKVVKRKFLLKKYLGEFGFPLVMKISGNKIVHKNKIRGVKLGINTYSEAIYEYFKFSKIRGFQGVMIQEQLDGIEIFFGIKKTNEFGHVLLFGQGGINVEKSEKISFGILPLNKNEIKKVIKGNSLGKKLSKPSFSIVEKTVINLNKLIEDNQNILELDINPFIVNNKNGKIADARIVFE